MDKEKILKLITSDKDEKKITKKLKNWLSKKPSLMDEVFLFDRTLFHLLVIHRKINTLRELLHDLSWKKHAVKTDRFGCTILHYAVRIEDNWQESIALILEQLPHLLNTQTNLGNTVLHESIKANNFNAFMFLVNNTQIDRSIKNSAGDDAKKFAGTSNELGQALIYTDFIAIKSLDLRYRTLLPEQKGIFQDTFPVLSSSPFIASTLPNGSPILRSSFNPPELESPDQDEVFGHGNHDNSAANKVLVKGKMTSLLQQVLWAYKINNKSHQYLQLQAELSALCKNHPLPDPSELNHLIQSSPETQEILLKIFQDIYSEVNRVYLKNQNTNCNLQKEFAGLLIQHDLIVDSTPLDAPQISPEYSEKSDHLKVLWLLTACQESHDSKRKFGFENIRNRTLGVLSTTSLLKILIGLRILYSSFDRHQKMVANFIVFQGLFYTLLDTIDGKCSFDYQLRLFNRLNIHPQIGLGTLGEKLNLMLGKLVRITVPLRNFYFLNQQITQFSHIQTKPSFDELINRAFTLKRGKRECEVHQIAQDLRVLTLDFYQKVSLSEFTSSSESPHINIFTSFFNKMSVYLIEKILTQPADNVVNSLQLLIELAQALCPLNGEHYPDLNHLMMLFTVLSNYNISRLATGMSGLQQEDKDLFVELSRLMNITNNSKYMRELYSIYRTTLPFLGGFQQDILFAYEGNKTDIDKMEAVGAILMRLMEIKLIANFEGVGFTTNLPVFLSEYVPPMDKELDAACLRYEPSLANIIFIDKEEIDLLAILKDISNCCLNNRIIPQLVYKKATHSLGQLINVLIILFNQELVSSNKSHLGEEERLSLLNQTYDGLKETIDNVTEVNNEYYYPRRLGNHIEPGLHAIKLAHFSQQIEQIAREIKASDTTSKFSRSRRKSIHGDRNLLFTSPYIKEQDQSERKTTADKAQLDLFSPESQLN